MGATVADHGEIDGGHLGPNLRSLQELVLPDAGRPPGVYAQRYDSNGNPLGSEFRVNTYTNSDQMAPSVAVASDGTFVIAWQSNGEDGGGWGVYAQRYDANGVTKGQEFRVNTITASDQTTPAVAMAADDSFVIVWQSNNQDGSNWGVYGQRYAADGNLNLGGGAGDVLAANGGQPEKVGLGPSAGGLGTPSGPHVNVVPSGAAVMVGQGLGCTQQTSAPILAPVSAGSPFAIASVTDLAGAWAGTGSMTLSPCRAYSVSAPGTGSLTPDAETWSQDSILTPSSLDGAWTEEGIQEGTRCPLEQDFPVSERYSALLAAATELVTEAQVSMTQWARACDLCFAEEPDAAVAIKAPIHSTPTEDRDAGALLCASGAVVFLAGIRTGGSKQTAPYRRSLLNRARPRERRRSLRFPCYLCASCRQVGTQLTEQRSAVARDLSRGGLNLILARPFLPGSQLIMELEGAIQGQTRWFAARVVHATELAPGQWMLGCVLNEGLNDGDVQALLWGDAARPAFRSRR